MPDTRPRIVPDVNPYTPPFNPNASSPLPPEVDVAALIQQLMTPAPAPQEQPGLLNTLASAFSNAAAVAISPNPGQALQQQLQLKSQQDFAAKQQEAEYRRQLDMMNRQFGLNIINSQIGEQVDIRKEGRQSKLRREEQDAANREWERRFNVEFKGREAMDEKNFKQQKEFFEIQRKWEAEKLDNQEYQFWYQQNRLENNKSIDLKLGLVRSGLSAGAATSIANKWLNDEPLTAAEEKALTASAQRQLRLAVGGGGGGRVAASSNLNQKEAFQLLYEAAKTPHVQLQDGTIMEASALPKDPITGRVVTPLGADGKPQQVKYLTPAETAQYTAQTVLPGIMSAISGGRSVTQTQPQSSTGGEQTVKVNFYLDQAVSALQSGVALDEVMQGLDAAKASIPNDSQFIDAAKTKLLGKRDGKIGKLKDIKNQARNFSVK